MITTVKALDYNIVRSLIKLMSDTVPGKLADYGLGGLTINVLPSYPRDLSKYKKPSIIVQKVGSSGQVLGFGNGFAGQHFDAGTNTLSDIYGTRDDHDIQIDTASDNNTQCQSLSSLIRDEVLLNIKYYGNRIDILDFTASEDDPQPMALAKISTEFDTAYFSNQYLSMTDRDYINHNYASIIRFGLLTTQLMCPAQEYVDLNKWIKVTGTIIGGN